MSQNVFAAHNENVKTAWESGRKEAIAEIVADLRKMAYDEPAKDARTDLLDLAERYEKGEHLVTV